MYLLFDLENFCNITKCAVHVDLSIFQFLTLSENNARSTISDASLHVVVSKLPNLSAARPIIFIPICLYAFRQEVYTIDNTRPTAQELKHWLFYPCI